MLKEECGIYGGICFKEDIAPYLKQGLQMLQHRGQESAGISCGDTKLEVYKNNGLVVEVLDNNLIRSVKGRSGIGHVRYSTQGGSDALNAQPYMIKYLNEEVAVAHNGNVKAAVEMKRHLEMCGEVFITTSETEMMLRKVIKTLCKPPSTWSYEEIGKILEMSFTGGAWSILFAFPGRIMAYRDPMGFRPLFFCISDTGYFVSSEDGAFHSLNNQEIIEIQPGEGIEIRPEGYEIKRFAAIRTPQQCVFEQIYFSRPDSNVFGRNVYMSRVELGRKAAFENPVDADMVVPVMESGFASSIGYSQASGIPLHMVLMKNHWVGRTFIQPGQKQRQSSVRQKLLPIKPLIRNKKLVLIDDSIVRGTTSREIVNILKEAGAKEVHFRTASPPIINTCYWGVDIPKKEELIINTRDTIEGVRKHINADSIGYLTVDSLKDIFGQDGWCYRCFMKGNNSEI